jgi:hypothetical protein
MTSPLHNPEFDAYYKGRNSVWNEEIKLERADFGSNEEWVSYKRGRRSAQAEEKLDQDTEWND